MYDENGFEKPMLTYGGGTGGVSKSNFETLETKVADLETTLIEDYAKIKTEYASKKIVNQQLSNLTSTLNQDVSATIKTQQDLRNDLVDNLSDYEKTSNVDRKIRLINSNNNSKYVEKSTFSNDMQNYVTGYSFSNELGSYAKSADLYATLTDYATLTFLSNNHVTSSNLSQCNYVTRSELSSNYVSTNVFNDSLTACNYLTSDSLTACNYLTSDSLTACNYITGNIDLSLSFNSNEGLCLKNGTSTINCVGFSNIENLLYSKNQYPLVS